MVNSESIKEYKEWEKFLGTEQGKKAINSWSDCECDNCTCDCRGCIWNLVGLEDEESQSEFLQRVKQFIENTVEELYLHPNWSTAECDEYGYEIGYLVDLYFRCNLI